MHLTCVEWTRPSVTMVIRNQSLISGETVMSDVHGHCLCKGISPGPGKGTSCSFAQINNALIFINSYFTFLVFIVPFLVCNHVD